MSDKVLEPIEFEQTMGHKIPIIWRKRDPGKRINARFAAKHICTERWMATVLHIVPIKSNVEKSYMPVNWWHN